MTRTRHPSLRHPPRLRPPPPRPPEWFGWPDDKAWFDDPAWYHRKGRVYVWWHESDYSSDFVRTQETTGDFPGGLKDLDTANPDVKEAGAAIGNAGAEAADAVKDTAGDVQAGVADASADAKREAEESRAATGDTTRR